MIVHAEDAGAIEHAPAAHGARVRGLPRARGRASAENSPIAHVIERGAPRPGRGCTSCTSRAPTRCRCCAARAATGVRITAETCPHYLVFAAEEVPDGATEYKCAPPIREAANRDALWAALAEGDIDSSCPTTRRARRS